jgi:hypothetical protein
MLYKSCVNGPQARGGHRFFRAPLVGAALLLSFEATAPAECAEPRNLVANGGFSQIEGGKPVHWVAAGDGGVAQTLEAAIENRNPCARLACTRCEPKTAASHAEAGRLR